MGHTTDVIATLRNGALSRRLDELLREVVQGINKTGKKGSVTLKLDIGKLKGGDTELEIKASVKHSVPYEDIPNGIYFPDAQGGLHREDPRQLTFDGELSDDGKTIDLAARRFAGATGDDI